MLETKSNVGMIECQSADDFGVLPPDSFTNTTSPIPGCRRRINLRMWLELPSICHLSLHPMPSSLPPFLASFLPPVTLALQRIRKHLRLIL